MSRRYYVPVGRSVGKPAGGIYSSGRDVPEEDISEFGPERVERMVELGRLAIRDVPSRQEPEPQPEREGRTGPVSPGKWSHDPASLSGKDLDELNVMILEQDDSIEPYETIEEAAAHLSQDYEAPQD